MEDSGTNKPLQVSPDLLKLNKKLRSKLSLEDIDPFETKRQVDSPLSLKACKMEGVLPKDLLFKPLDHFQKGSLDAQMAELKYRIHEAKRLKNLELVRDTRMRLGSAASLQSSPASVYKQSVFKQKMLARNYNSTQNLCFSKPPNSESFLRLGSTGDHTPVNSRFLNTRFSPGTSQTSARRFLRTYTQSQNMIANALAVHHQALDQKLSSVQLGLSKDLGMFRRVVRNEQVKHAKTLSFNGDVEKYQSAKKQKNEYLERESKLKSDLFIQSKIQRETEQIEKQIEEKKIFKKEIYFRDQLSLQQISKTLTKKERVQSAKLLSDLHRHEIYSRSEDFTNDYLQTMQIKLRRKEERSLSAKTQLETQKKLWLQKFKLYSEKGNRARQQLKDREEAKYSFEVRQMNLRWKELEIEEKGKRAESKRKDLVGRLNSANKIKQDKVQLAYFHIENQIQQRSKFLQLQESQSQSYIDKILKQREDKIRKQREVFQMKRELTQKNQKMLERQRKYQAKEVKKKIEEHFKAYVETGNQKTGIEQQKIKHQFDLEKRKAEIRETMYRMQIWNCWDERVLELVFRRPVGTSIDNVVREFASRQSMQSKMEGKEEESVSQN